MRTSKSTKQTTNFVGLDSKQAQAIADKLNILLADYQVLTMSTRNLHWNIKGEHFFELHVKYGEFYEEFQTKVDEIAERIVALDAWPLHTFASYLKVSRLKEAPTITKAPEGVAYVADSLKKIVELEREIIALSETAKDHCTNNLLTEYIITQEKQLWMLHAYLS